MNTQIHYMVLLLRNIQTYDVEFDLDLPCSVTNDRINFVYKKCSLCWGFHHYLRLKGMSLSHGPESQIFHMAWETVHKCFNILPVESHNLKLANLWLTSWLLWKLQSCYAFVSKEYTWIVVATSTISTAPNQIMCILNSVGKYEKCTIAMQVVVGCFASAIITHHG